MSQNAIAIAFTVGIYTIYALVIALIFRFYILKGLSVKGWQDWLDTLNTGGGNIVTLFICSCLSGYIWAWSYTHYPGKSDLVMGTFGLFGGFTGALLQAQKGNSSRQQMVDRFESVHPPPIPEEPKPGVTLSKTEIVTTTGTNTNPPSTPSKGVM